MLERFLNRIAGLCLNRSLTVVFVSFALLLIALFLAFRLEFSTDVRQLLPKSDPRVKVFFNAMSQFAGSETLIGVVSSSGDRDDRLVQEFVRNFSESIAESELVESVDSNANQLALVFFREFFLKHIFLFLDERDFNDVVEALSEDGMRRALRQARATLVSQAGLVQKEFIAHDPLNLRRYMFKYSPRLREGFKLDIVDGYYFSKDHRMGFVLINPSENAQNLEFDRALLGFLRRTADETLSSLDDLHGWGRGHAAKRLSIAFTGSHAILLEEGDVIKHDMFTTLTASFVLVIVLFVVSFGRLGSVFYVGIPLLSALAFTLALCYLTLGYVNVLTIVLVVCIIGLGIDFALHLYSRYADERALGKTGEDAMRLSYTRTGVGTLACAATTSLAFLSCALSRFEGIRELGFLAAAGIVICLLTTLVFMGALLRQQERFARRGFKAPRIAVFGLNRVAKLVSNHPGAVIAVWAILTLLAAVRMSDVEFSEDISRLRAKTSKAVQLQRKISDEVGGSFKDWVAFVSVPDSQSALRFSEEAQRECEKMIADGTLSSASSLLDFVPSLSRQKENIARLTQLSTQTAPQEIVSGFEAAVAESGLRMTDRYKAYIQRLASSLFARDTMDLGALAVEASLQRLLGRFLQASDTGYSVACYMSPPKLLNKKRDVLAFKKRLQDRLGDSASITSSMYLTAFLKDIITEDIWLIAIVAGALVLGILLVQFRRLTIALIAMAPLCSGALMMLAAASMLGIDLNPINLFVIPMILGIGIDDGIHLVHRFLERRSTARDAIVGTGKALVLTSLTTILAFGTLVFAGFEGLVQVGVFTILGVGFALLASITFLPALLLKCVRRKDGR